MKRLNNILNNIQVDVLVLWLLVLWSIGISIFQLLSIPFPNSEQCLNLIEKKFREKKIEFQQPQLEIICQEEIQNYNTTYILLLLSVLAFSMLVERYRKINTLQNTINELQAVLNMADFKQQVIPIVGYQQWFKTATAIMKEAKNTIYDVSLSSRTWYEKDKDGEREKFNKIRKKCFKNPLLETKYLTTFKTYLKENDFTELVDKLKKEEYDLESYRNKLEADIKRINMIKELKDYNFRAAYLRGIKLKTPLLSFLIVDSNKVLLGFYQSEFRESNIGQDKALLIENEEVADLFYQYFDLLWNNSTKFAHDSHELVDILNKLTQQQTIIEGSENDNPKPTENKPV